MNVHFVVENDEVVGEASHLSVHGVYVTSQHEVPHTQVQLRFAMDNEDDLSILGHIVRTTAQGFSVAFPALAPVELLKLTQLLGTKSNPLLQESLDALDGLGNQRVDIQWSDWTPPVSGELSYGGQTDPQPTHKNAENWRALPTISQSIAVFGTTISDTEQASSGSSALGRSEPTQPDIPDTTQSTEPAPKAEDVVGVDRRQSDRQQISIPVAFENLTGLIKEFTHNISYGGMFVYSAQPQQQNAQTSVTLIHPVHGERLTLQAKVVHASQAPTPDPQSGQPRYGLGLEFGLPLEELKKILADFIGSHQKKETSTPVENVVQKAKEMLQKGDDSFHALLEVAQDASNDAIRQAYFKLVDEFHPDRYFGKIDSSGQKILERLFRLATKAYEDLTT